jgi:hypothetical protein
LTFTEEAGVLALARAIMPCNHKQDKDPAFFVSEMVRSYNNAKPVFKMTGDEENISCQIFDLPHGFLKEDREAMLGWFEKHLKGIGSGESKKEGHYDLLTEEDLMVFKKGERDPRVLTTVEYSIIKGNELRAAFLNKKVLNVDQKKKELRDILRLNEMSDLKKIHQFPSQKGWDRFALETSDNKLIPLLHFAPANKSAGYVILCDPLGKSRIDLSYIDELKKKGSGIVIVDLTGTGEASTSMDKSSRGILLHNLSRAELWLGKTILGEWVKELTIVNQFLKTSYQAQKVSIDGSKEAGLAALFLCAVSADDKIENLIIRNAPLSYIFDKKENIDFFSMGIHLPGFLIWGDVSLAVALCGKNVSFINPVTMSGQKIDGDKLEEFMREFKNLRSICNQPGITIFN